MGQLFTAYRNVRFYGHSEFIDAQTGVELWSNGTLSPTANVTYIELDANGQNKGIQWSLQDGGLTDYWGYLATSFSGTRHQLYAGALVCSYFESGGDANSVLGLSIGSGDGYPWGGGQQSAYIRASVRVGSSPRWEIAVNHGDGNAETLQTSTTNAPVAGKVYALEIRFDPISPVLAMYVDGTSVASIAANANFFNHGGSGGLGLHAISGNVANARHTARFAAPYYAIGS